MKRVFLRMIVAALFSGLLLADAQTIRIAGSDVIGVRTMPHLAEHYKLKHPEVTFAISAEGSSHGFKAVLENRVEIGMSSREMTAGDIKQFADRGIKVSRWYVATDVFVVAVNSDNPVEGLTTKQVKSIFAGDVRDWSEVGGRPGEINLHMRSRSSGSAMDFRQIALGGRELGKARIRLSTDQPSLAIAGDGNGIGWISRAYTKTDRIKVLKIDGQSPLGEHVRSYPYLRELWCYTSQPAGTPAHDFLKWVTTTAEAGEVIRKTGFLILEKKAD